MKRMTHAIIAALVAALCGGAAFAAQPAGQAATVKSTRTLGTAKSHRIVRNYHKPRKMAKRTLSARSAARVKISAH
jgi:hypothetical protein